MLKGKAMEAQVENGVRVSRKNVNFGSVRIGKDTRRKILSDLSKINKKDYGKRVLIDEYVAYSINKLTSEDLKTDTKPAIRQTKNQGGTLSLRVTDFAKPDTFYAITKLGNDMIILKEIEMKIKSEG